MSKLLITSRPINDMSVAYLLIENEDRGLEKYLLSQNAPITISFSDKSKKYCVGWYDVTTHTNLVCEDSREVDVKYDSCFECRKKTGFNPAFYNTSDISNVQQEYNSKPHSVYVSYFGDGLVKAGIMSDSRGLERLFEQGAIFYCIVDSFDNADEAHKVESQLINKGLRNSVTKKQKEKVLSKPFDQNAERQAFAKTMQNLELGDKEVTSNLDHFFFGNCPNKAVEPIGDNPISGLISGVIGRYLILNNNDRLYGFWLSDLAGYKINVSSDVIGIDAKPEQVSLFG